MYFVFVFVCLFFHRTFRVYHVYCNFITGYMCWITVRVIFGTLEDEGLLISNIFVSNNCSKNGVDALSKLDDAFFTKSWNIYIVWIIKCSNFASLWHKHLSQNYKWNFRLLMSAFATVTWNAYWNINFLHGFMFKLFHDFIAVANRRSSNTICNSLLTIFTTIWQNLNKLGWSELHKIWIFWQTCLLC